MYESSSQHCDVQNVEKQCWLQNKGHWRNYASSLNIQYVSHCVYSFIAYWTRPKDTIQLVASVEHSKRRGKSVVNCSFNILIYYVVIIAK